MSPASMSSSSPPSTMACAGDTARHFRTRPTVAGLHGAARSSTQQQQQQQHAAASAAADADAAACSSRTQDAAARSSTSSTQQCAATAALQLYLQCGRAHEVLPDRNGRLDVGHGPPVARRHVHRLARTLHLKYSSVGRRRRCRASWKVQRVQSNSRRNNHQRVRKLRQAVRSRSPVRCARGRRPRRRFWARPEPPARGLSSCWHPLSIRVETPTEGREGCSRMAVPPTASQASRNQDGEVCSTPSSRRDDCEHTTALFRENGRQLHDSVETQRKAEEAKLGGRLGTQRKQSCLA